MRTSVEYSSSAKAAGASALAPATAMKLRRCMADLAEAVFDDGAIQLARPQHGRGKPRFIRCVGQPLRLEDQAAAELRVCARQVLPVVELQTRSAAEHGHGDVALRRAELAGAIRV